ncbi:MAG TPA: AAA family ATPase [Phycisphaerae bacterium]|nr:AAA family ATPase [Phycisphaerae bacterium]HNU43689.1 AAA family ATPase [Phycisphaerae bacterium]
MYADYFGLRELPFNNTPDPRFFFSTPDHEEALASLIYAVNEQKGFVLLTGEVGTGKTLIARMMLRQFGDRICFANLNHTISNGRELLEAVSTEFDLPFDHKTSNAQLVRQLHDHLLTRFGTGTPVVLIVDEAQNLPVDAFELLRTIGNLEADDAKLLQIIIIGQPELQRRFLEPNLRQLRQRIFRCFHLPSLSRELTEGYIQHRLTLAGGQNLDIFDTRAIDRIHEYTQGLPRLINTLCDNAMLSAYSADRHQIDAEFLESVIAQMMTIEPPAPAVGLPPRSAQGAGGRCLTGGTASSRRSASGAGLPSGALAAARPPAGQPTGARCDESVTASPSSVREAQAVHARLHSAVELARTLLDRLQPALAGVQDRDHTTHELTETARTTLRETRKLHRRIEDIAAQAHDLQTQVRSSLDRIAEQFERTNRLALSLKQTADRTETLAAARTRLPELQEHARSGTGRPRLAAPRDAGRVEQLLHEGRQSLAELRSLLTGAGGGPGADPLLSLPVSAAASAGVADPPAARLAQQVQGLVSLMEQHEAHAGLADFVPA